VELTLRLNDQQLRALEPLLAAASLDELVARGVDYDRSRGVDPSRALARPPARGPSGPHPGARLDELVEAGTALGVALGAGDLVRIEQVVEGQCVDVNLFALGAEGQRFDAARTRAAHGLRVTTGAVLVSTSPELELAEIVADTSGPHDLCFPACSAAELGSLSGCVDHSNCVDLQREAQRYWGLPAAAQHDPLNLWLLSDVLPDGRLSYWPAACRVGDFVELRALRDVLVVVNPCASDLFGSAQWELGPVRVVVVGGDPPASPSGPEPVWRWRGMPFRELVVTVDAERLEHIARVRELGWLGFSDAEVARALLLRWWEHEQGIPADVSR
jgi:uncharacterized protein